ncbi:MAG: general secretion pathway protein GspE [Bacteroidetes bacterium RIFCSPLOWO2_12_FULL_35_15]|nr:MAG: general secretion pathway protein GspE [Bacteroidetes bacterium RIFCSPLOWO2_12_FULL_35_15]
MNETDHISLSIDLQHAITPQQAWHYTIIPKHVDGDKQMTLYVSEEKFHTQLSDELEMLFGKTILLEKASSEVIQKTLGKYYRNTNVHATIKQVSSGNVKADDFLPMLISEAKSLGSSDIHIEAYEEKCRVRIRIDGLLIERYTISKLEYPSLINKIKIKANLDISEKRLPQDGRIFFNDDGHKFDIRVSVLPTLHGEKIVLRLLSNDAADIEIERLGFNARELEDYLEGIKKPHGIILISGPTGSGKTTTLYATLKILNKEKSNIITIEDPIEYTLEGINQVQLKESIGLTFAGALRSFLRQDPDVIMLGEIRDGETAQMAIRAALTGHLVLSTIHTNSAWGTISRLADMGVPPFLLASTLNTTVAQRLLRLLCTECKEEKEFDVKYFPKTFKAPRIIQKYYVPKGCEHCHYTGYKGRKAIYEVIPIDFELADHIKNNIFTVEALLKERNIKTLRENAFELFEKGVTSIDEIYPILLNSY